MLAQTAMNDITPVQPHRAPFVSTRRPLSRRQFLQGAGIALSLPFLESMLPTFSRGTIIIAAFTRCEAAPHVWHLQ